MQIINKRSHQIKELKERKKLPTKEIFLKYVHT